MYMQNQQIYSLKCRKWWIC